MVGVLRCSGMAFILFFWLRIDVTYVFDMGFCLKLVTSTGEKKNFARRRLSIGVSRQLVCIRNMDCDDC